ncbi:tetratricopeptide repeat protein [Actinacidiphila alni]|uniref:tetratricopeptide repeat protein n=1 Tax=Actinacidiphila alni TaxID=380248 RepID=UPI0033FDACC9
MDVARVMEIWCPAAGAVGSGYAIGADLVLTAYHVVRGTGPGGTVKVRQLDRNGRTVWLTARLCWPPGPVDTRREPERDGALLHITDPGWQAPATGGAVRFGRITGTERLRCQGVGFPDATKHPGSSRRGSMPVSGYFEPLYDYRSALIAVHVSDGIVPRRLPGGSGWAGSSGAALFTGRHLVAVLATDKAVADTAKVLEATPVAVLMEQPGFIRTLRDHDAPVGIDDLAAGTGEAQDGRTGAAALGSPVLPVLPPETGALGAGTAPGTGTGTDPTGGLDTGYGYGPGNTSGPGSGPGIASAIAPAPAAAPPPLRGLPRRSPVFAGREAALSRLLDLLRPDADEPSPVGVVTGLPGVGKTELAVQAAHLALERGWFPGGTLFIDARRYDQERTMTVEAALDELLRAMGVPAEDIPTDDPAGDHRSRLLTAKLAEYAAAGRRILVVIDNVMRPELAKALLPAVGCAVLTSRNALAEIPGQRIDLDELDRAAAVDMLDGELRLAHSDDTRVADQYEDAVAVARLCGELPLALHIIAALLTEDTARPLASMAEDLHAADTRLDELRYREDTRGERGVRAALDLSYRQLGDEQARLLRLLTINVGSEVSTEAVAAMAQLDVRTTRRLLEELRSTHLIRSGNSYGRHGRWRMHDLVRLYASELPARRTELRVAFLLLLLHYVEFAMRASWLLAPGADRPADPPGTGRPADGPFRDRAQALAWLDTEYANLTPYSRLYISEPAYASTVTLDLFLGMWRYFELRRRTDDWIEFTLGALAVSRAIGDRACEAEALTKLGGAYRQARRFDEAARVCREAIAIQRERGERHSEGVAVNNLAGALLEAGKYEEAVPVAREAVAIFREAGDRHRVGLALSHLGGALWGTGQHAEAATVYEESARLGNETGDPRFNATMIARLGDSRHVRGASPEEVIELHRRAREDMVRAVDPHSEAMVLGNLCVALLNAGRAEEAVTAARDAAGLLRTVEDAHGLGAVLVNLGSALREAGRPGEAVEAFTEAVAAYRSSADPAMEVKAALGLAEALRAAGDTPAAIASLRETVAQCRTRQDRRGEGRALGGLGYALSESKRHEEGEATLRAAAELSHEAGDTVGEAMALVSLGTALLPERIDDALAVLRSAATLYLRTGRPDHARAAAGVLRTVRSTERARTAFEALFAAGRYGEVMAGYRSSALRRRTDDHPGLAAAIARELGLRFRAVGRFGEAAGLLEDAATAFRDAGDEERERAARADLESVRAAERAAADAADALREALRRTEGGDDSGLTAAVDGAVRHLGPADARFFRLLTAGPGPAYSLEAAALLVVADRATVLARLEELTALAMKREHLRLHGRMTDMFREDTATARGTLDLLSRMRLLERVPDDPRRRRLPAAIRPYAAALGARHAGPDLRTPVRTLLRLHYLGAASSASAPLDNGAFAPALQSAQATGLSQLVAEYPQLVATVLDAGDDDLGAVVATDLTRALTHVMSLGHRTEDARRLGTVARRAARRLRDRTAEAVIARNLGGALLSAGRLDQAVSALRAALALYRAAGDAHGEGTTMSTLGSALTHAGDFPEAETLLRAAVALQHGRGNAFSEAVALFNLGILLMRTDRTEEAITAFSAADHLYRRTGDHPHRALTLTHLATCLQAAGRPAEAAKATDRAATLTRLTGLGG